MTKDDVKHSRYYALEPDEVERLISFSVGVERFIISNLVYGGMRRSEVAHMRRGWLHIKDHAAKLMGANHIKLPEGRIPCDCETCQRQAYWKLMRDGERKTKEWYAETQSEFYQLKSKGELPKLDSYWMPKSKSGSRVIPILNNEYKKELRRWFKVHDKVDINPLKIYAMVKRVGKLAFGPDKIIYPHVLRATAATILANNSLSERNLTLFMGWKDANSAKPYVKDNQRKMIKDMKKIKHKK